MALPLQEFNKTKQLTLLTQNNKKNKTENYISSTWLFNWLSAWST